MWVSNAKAELGWRPAMPSYQRGVRAFVDSAIAAR
jgi:hypothetical protein